MCGSCIDALCFACPCFHNCCVAGQPLMYRMSNHHDYGMTGLTCIEASSAVSFSESCSGVSGEGRVHISSSALSSAAFLVNLQCACDSFGWGAEVAGQNPPQPATEVKVILCQLVYYRALGLLMACMSHVGHAESATPTCVLQHYV
jgi:hypothetical protein